MVISLAGISDSSDRYYSVASEKNFSYGQKELHWQPGVYYTAEAARLAAEKNSRIEEQYRQDAEDSDARIKEIWANGNACELTLSNVVTPEKKAEYAAQQGSKVMGESQPRTYDLSYWEVQDALRYGEVAEKDNYLIDGVEFTGKEMKAFQTFFNNLKEFLPPRSSFGMDYKYYAVMGMGISMTNAYGAKNFTEEQAASIGRVVQYYMDELIYTKNQRMNLYQPTNKLESRYYNMYISDKKFKEVEGWGSGDSYSRVVSEATDLGLARGILDLYANSDIEDEDSMMEALKKYLLWMKPAYEELVPGELGNRWGVQEDTGYFSKKISDARALLQTVNPNGVDIRL